MKTSQTPATSKLLIRYDNELKALLMQDLKAFRDGSRFTGNTQPAAQQAAWSTYTSTYKKYTTYESDRALHYVRLYFFADF